MIKLADKVRHQLPVEEAVQFLGVNCSTGLSAQEAAQHLAADRPNELKEGKRISRLQIFSRPVQRRRHSLGDDYR